MNRNTELAMLAGASYESSRENINKIPVPDGWSSLILSTWPGGYGSQSRPETNVPGRAYWQDKTTGFEAAAYSKGNEVVISFAGTYFEGELKADMVDNNVPLGFGKVTDQMKQAAEFIRRVKSDPTMAGKTITLTGHSLGGGLASLMAVMFDLPAVTFDPAPFRAAATQDNAQLIKTYLDNKGLGIDNKLDTFTSSGSVPVPAGLLLRLLGPFAAGLATTAGIPAIVWVPSTVAREANVQAIALQGEFLTGQGTDASARDLLRIHSGNLELVANNATNVAGSQLHSQALLTLILESRSGEADRGFYLAANDYKSFLGLFFNKVLFEFQRTDATSPTLIEHILRHQFGVAAGSPNGAAVVAQDNMLSVMGRDLRKIGTPMDGFIERFQEGILSAVLRHYYTSVSPTATPERYTGGVLKELLAVETGGVSFKITDVELGGTTFKNWQAFSQGILGETQTGLPQLDNPAYASLVRARVPLSERVSASTSAALSVDFAQDTLRDLALGADGADNLRTGGGDDFIYAGLGNDTLDGGTGNDLLLGGAGNDTYQFTGTWGKDTVIDADGLGSIQIGTTTLGSATGAGTRDQWAFDLGGGIYAGIAVTADSSSSTGYRATIVKGTDTANTITLQNFNLTAALTNTGYLGIKLDPTQRVALIQGSAQSLGASTSNVYADLGFNTASLTGQSSQFNEGNGKTFSINLAVAAHAGDTITLSANGAVAGNLQAVLGDSTVAANGAVITLAEGQTQVSFALVSSSAIEADVMGALSASYAGTGAGAQTASSNSVALTVKDTGTPTNTYNGDYFVATMGWRNPTDNVTRTDPQGQTVTVVGPGDTMLGIENDFNLARSASTMNSANALLVTDNVIFGSTGRDAINGLSGNDGLTGGTGNDTIDGGAGDDFIGGGAGADSIKGGDGNDFISGSGSIEDIYLQQRGNNDTWNRWGLPTGRTAITQGSTWGTYLDSNGQVVWSGMGDTRTDTAATEGDTIDAGAGDDQVLGSWADDRIQGGDGADVLAGLAGNDVIEGGLGNDRIDADGLTQAGYLSSVAASSHGNDFVDGGEGDDEITGGGGADQLFGGNGADIIFADTGVASSSPFFVDLAYHGADYIDGEGGNDTIEGGGKNDTIYGGEGNDNLRGDFITSRLTAAQAALQSSWGDDYLDGEEGDDLLWGGGGNDTLYGSTGKDQLIGDESSPALAGAVQGEDYLDGEAGDDLLIGGGKDDTLVGGSGNDFLEGDEDTDRLTGEWHGADNLDGGDAITLSANGAVAGGLMGARANSMRSYYRKSSCSRNILLGCRAKNNIKKPNTGVQHV